MRPWVVVGLHSAGLLVLFTCPTQLRACLYGVLQQTPGWTGDAGYVLTAFTAIGTTIALFTRCYGSDPGFLPRATEQDKAAGFQVCPDCGARQTVRCRHCYKTGRCVNAFDHWCPNMGTTIGDKNHRLFWSYLLAQAFTITWGFLLAAVPTLQCLWPSSPAVKTSCWRSNLLQTFLLLGASAGLGAGVNIFWGLWAYHSFLVSTGQTTWEIIRGPYVPYLGDYFVGWQNRLPPPILHMNPLARGVMRYAFRCPPPTPFSEGFVRNWDIFLYAPKPYLYEQQYPPQVQDHDPV